MKRVLSPIAGVLFLTGFAMSGFAQSATDYGQTGGSSSEAQPPYYNGSTKPPGQDTHSNANSNGVSGESQIDPYAIANTGRPVEHRNQSKRSKGEQINPSTSSGPINPSTGNAAGPRGAGSGAGAGAGVP